jgi:hypothetical protein
VKKLEENKEFVRMTVERQTSGGVLSSLFGDKFLPPKEEPIQVISESDSSRFINDHLDG